jgi:hypothetical protein
VWYGQNQGHRKASDDAAAPLDYGAGCRCNVFGRFDEPAEDVAWVDKHWNNRGEIDGGFSYESIAKHADTVHRHCCDSDAVASK